MDHNCKNLAHLCFNLFFTERPLILDIFGQVLHSDEIKNDHLVKICTVK